MVRDTVAVETRARLAISRMSIGWVRRSAHSARNGNDIKLRQSFTQFGYSAYASDLRGRLNSCVNSHCKGFASYNLWHELLWLRTVKVRSV